MATQSKTSLALFCFFLGGIGVHRFMVGKVGTGILYLFTLGLLGFGVLVDFIICLNQDLEQCVSNEQLEKCRLKILNKITTELNSKANVINNLYTIADYRREFNDNYCNKCDVLMWGESDSLLPKLTFNILNVRCKF